MAQVQFVGDTAVITFDERDKPVVDKAKGTDPDFLQNAVIEFLNVTARNQNQAELLQKIEEIKLGQFGKLGTMRMA